MLNPLIWPTGWNHQYVKEETSVDAAAWSSPTDEEGGSDIRTNLRVWAKGFLTFAVRQNGMDVQSQSIHLATKNEMSFGSEQLYISKLATCMSLFDCWKSRANGSPGPNVRVQCWTSVVKPVLLASPKKCPFDHSPTAGSKGSKSVAFSRMPMLPGEKHTRQGSSNAPKLDRKKSQHILYSTCTSEPFAEHGTTVEQG